MALHPQLCTKSLKYLLSGSIRRLTVIHEDRLLRFGVGLIKFICKWTKTDFVVVDPKEVVTFEAELAKDGGVAKVRFS